MSRGASPLLGTTLVAAALLASLTLVAWRQARAREVLAEVDQLRRELALSASERADLQAKIHYLGSRGRVLPAARERLEMRTPNAGEIVILPAEGP